MSEMVAEVKTLTVHMICDKCGNGLMSRYGNIILTAYPPQYPHKCNNCGYEENYPIMYPYNRLVPIEQLRHPTEDESNPCVMNEIGGD